PWQRIVEISAAGLFAGGWGAKEDFILISRDGYSVTDLATGKLVMRNLEGSLARHPLDDMLYNDDLSFRIPEMDYDINVFGRNAGDGIRTAGGGWVLETIYPRWPGKTVTLRQALRGIPTAIEDYAAIKHGIDSSWLRTGFSPSGRHFVIMGDGGMVIFSRQFT
ncbi:MAG: hypothetical protein H7Y11_02005, partial [Armatimonadetes bacterium]|nr:hypothetical protein [Anaerolineae bacterium]